MLDTTLSHLGKRGEPVYRQIKYTRHVDRFMRPRGSHHILKRCFAFSLREVACSAVKGWSRR